MANSEVKVKVTLDSKDAEKSIKSFGQNAENAGKKATGAFSTLGNTLKSLGIITVLSKAFTFFQETLMKNQKIADGFAIAMEFLSNVFNDLFNFIFKNAGKVTEFFKDVFENPSEYVEKLAKAIKDNLIERVASLIESFSFLGETLKNLFTGEFQAAIDSAKKFGKEVVDVFTGIDDSFDKGAEVITNAAAAVSNYAKSTFDASKATVELKNNAKIAAAQAQLEAVRLKREAEEQRQIRDDVSRSINERIQANTKLGQILDKQLQKELQASQLQVEVAKREFAKTGNIEDQVSLLNALAQLEDKREQIAGQRSEQLVNTISLERELIEIQKIRGQVENELYIAQLKANAEIVTDDLIKLEAQKMIAEEEAAIELIRLKNNIDLYKENTLERANAEAEFAKKKQEIEIQLTNFDVEIQRVAFERQKEYYQKQRELYQADREAFRELQNAKYNLAQQGLAALTSLVGENEKLANVLFAVQKALEVGKIIASTASAITQVSAQTAAIPAILPPGIPNPAYPAALAINAKKIASLKINAAAQIATIVAGSIAKFKSGSAQQPSTNAGGGSGLAGAPITPQGLFQQSNTTRLDQQSINQLGAATSRAYVIESDVTNSQDRVARINRAARIG